MSFPFFSGQQTIPRARKPKMTAVIQMRSCRRREALVIVAFVEKANTTVALPAKKLSSSNIHGEITNEHIPRNIRTPKTVRRNLSSFSESVFISSFCCRFLSRTVVVPCVQSSPT